jgi:hypothetical protein
VHPDSDKKEQDTSFHPVHSDSNEQGVYCGFLAAKTPGIQINT